MVQRGAFNQTQQANSLGDTAAYVTLFDADWSECVRKLVTLATNGPVEFERTRGNKSLTRAHLAVVLRAKNHWNVQFQLSNFFPFYP